MTFRVITLKGIPMNLRSLFVTTITISLFIAPQINADEMAQAPAPTIEQQIQGLETMCSESADARAKRQKENSLYERLGGYDNILEFTTEIVRLHSINPTIKHTLDGVDHASLAKHVADFTSAGTGGTAKYTGRDMVSSHKSMKLTDEHFLAAGSDVMKAMKSLGHGENEVNEFVCILVSLKDQVVLK